MSASSSPPPASPAVRSPPVTLTITPIGQVRTPFTEKMQAPRQPDAGACRAEGRIELFPGRHFEHALADLETWTRIWVLFWFHLNDGWRPKVLPPRSAGRRRGVFATRSPHRPNPIGLSALELLEVRSDDRVLVVRGVDMLDGTPVIDIKPYVPYTDAHPEAGAGWLSPLAAGQGRRPDAAVDPEPGFAVSWSERAREQAAWLRAAHDIDLVTPAEHVLSVGPQPHPYRRIRREGAGYCLAVKEWRVRFGVDGRSVVIESVSSGYRAAELASSEAAPSLNIHREFRARYG